MSRYKSPPPNFSRTLVKKDSPHIRRLIPKRGKRGKLVLKPDHSKNQQTHIVEKSATLGSLLHMQRMLSPWHFQSDHRGTTVQSLNCLGKAWHRGTCIPQQLSFTENQLGVTTRLHVKTRVFNHRYPVAIGDFPAFSVATDSPAEIVSQDSGGPPKASFALEIRTSRNASPASSQQVGDLGPAFQTRW